MGDTCHDYRGLPHDSKTISRTRCPDSYVESRGRVRSFRNPVDDPNVLNGRATLGSTKRKVFKMRPTGRRQTPW